MRAPATLDTEFTEEHGLTRTRQSQLAPAACHRQPAAPSELNRYQIKDHGQRAMTVNSEAPPLRAEARNVSRSRMFGVDGHLRIAP